MIKYKYKNKHITIQTIDLHYETNCLLITNSIQVVHI